MACDRDQSVNSFFSSIKNQGGVNIHSGSVGTMGLPSVLVPSVSRCDPEVEKPYRLWSDTPGESHDLAKHVQELLRKLPDNLNREGLANQQSLVSNMLDEKELSDTHQQHWKTPARDPYSEMLAGKILAYWESNSKTQSNSTNFLNCEEFPDTAFKDQFPQLLPEPNTREQWLLNLPVGDLENLLTYELQSDPAFSIDLPQRKETKSESEDQGLFNYNEVNDTPWIQCDKADQNFGLSYNNQYFQSGANQFVKERDGPEDLSHVGSSRESFMPDRWNGLSNVSKQLTTSRKGDVAKQCGIGWVPANGRVTNTSFIGDNFSKYFLPPKSANVSLSNPGSHTNKNSHAELNASVCQNSSSQMERRICSQMQKENTGMEMSTSIRGLLQMSPSTIEQMIKEERRQSPQFNQHSDLLRSNVMRSANTKHFMSHTAYEPWRYPMLHTKSKISNSIDNHRSNWPHHVPVKFPTGMLGNYPAEISSGDDQSEDDQWTYADQLSHYLHECEAQCRSLKEDRQKVAAILDKTFGKPLQRATDPTDPTDPNLLNDLEIFQLMANQLREQAQVASLVERMHSLCSHPLFGNIHATLNHHQTTICITQARIKDAHGNKETFQHQVTYTDDKVTQLLMISMKDLAGTTRKLRTTLWCALQMTLPEPLDVLDDHDCREKADTESVSEGYSFKI